MKGIYFECLMCHQIVVYPENHSDVPSCQCGGKLVPSGRCKVVYEKEHYNESEKPNRKIWFKCDHRACSHKEKCNCAKCGYTADIAHAQNFELKGRAWFERNDSNS